MKLLSHVLFIARIEARLFLHDPKIWLATAAVALIPALYAVIYLSSVWDPAANTGALTVALVNLDRGVEYREHVFNVGAEVVSKLKRHSRFGFRDYTDEQQVRQQVRQGKLTFALIIPPDFSSNAIPGAEAGAGKLVVYTSEGNSYQSAALARRFAEDLGHEVNESLNERRWALVLSNAAGSQRSVDRLREGVGQLRAGVKELGDGANQTASAARSVAGGAGRLNEGVAQLSAGVRQLGGELRGAEARRTPNAELNRLKSGAEALATGHTELGQGLAELEAGSQRLKERIVAFRDEANSSTFASARVKEGIEQLGEGVSQLDAGLQSAGAAQQKLADGANKLNTGVGTLTGGVRTLGGGLRTAVASLPEDSQLDELTRGAGHLASGATTLSEGTQKLRQGVQRLTSGVDLLFAMLPASVQQLGGSAQGLANSVQPVVEMDAVVQNNASGFAPNLIPGALWLGAGIAAFLIHARTLPRQAQFFSPPAKMLGKILLPSVVVVVQAMLVVATLRYVLKIGIFNPNAFALTLGLTSLTSLFIVFALTRAFGDAGKALSLILLTVQLSASGGFLPVELSGGWFADISPWLPLTWVVTAIKASMFGAYDAQWQYPLLLVGLAGLAAAAIACVVGRWRYVRHSAIRPAMDL